MKQYLLIVFFVLTGALSGYGQVVRRPNPGPPGSWRLLGTVSARHTADHDVIYVKGPYDYFRKIKFKVTDSPVNIHRLVVTYENGVPDNIETRFSIPRGGESRIIDLRGGKRKLKSIEFWYDTRGILNGRADVTVFGIK